MLRTTFTCTQCGRYVTEDGVVDEAVCRPCRNLAAAHASVRKSQPPPREKDAHVVVERSPEIVAPIVQVGGFGD